MALFEIVTMTDDSGMSRVLTDDIAAWVEDCLLYTSDTADE